ncbi:RNA polymerase [Tilletiaria anomala UBC 951]|uniref:DNA-directed RNA polymerases I, II, and III subunit RPABC3 n=1 Tax=Tilletiaria anomala (strain ATCC 24038 / CBS 436.72 / UBC 951) TaxID=1037660 RepID=A0A066VZR8_TILAU|nr:RNA polymerase [Tilletiaria anomala UBC 951]KDN46971.1 RNA polymerase [Tilletiaria anomala UBC 951]
MASDPTNIFDAQFSVSKIDPDGKKFDRVSRIEAYSQASDIKLSIDIATDIYSMVNRPNFTLQLATQLQRGTGNEDVDQQGDGGAGAAQGRPEAWRIDVPGNEGISADFDYVMYGKIYKFDEGHSDTVTVYGSFGGLLMALTGSYRHLSGITIGTYVYLLIR